jgi:hypothetical protein
MPSGLRSNRPFSKDPAGVRKATTGSARSKAVTSKGTRMSTTYCATLSHDLAAPASGATAIANNRIIESPSADLMPAKEPLIADTHPPTEVAVTTTAKIPAAAALPEALNPEVKNRNPKPPNVRK